MLTEDETNEYYMLRKLDEECVKWGVTLNPTKPVLGNVGENLVLRHGNREHNVLRWPNKIFRWKLQHRRKRGRAIKFCRLPNRAMAPSVEPLTSPQNSPEILGRREEMSTITQKIWNLSRLSFDGSDRTNLLYRQDLHRHFLIGSGVPGEDSSSMLRTSGIAMGLKHNVDCSTCLNHNSAVYAATDNSNKIT
ncbi:hypothetical protein JTB14_013644 [Gonioctena quinquepunctata]|nr:hypothetical protein JTB14_013644 [Gonioctena quinquepunctata]